MDEKIQNIARSVLQREFKNRVDKNAKYSLRAYAKLLGIDPSSLSQFFRKKRILSERQLKKHLSRLGLDYKKFQDLDAKNELEQVFPVQYVEDFEALRNWYHLAIIECFELDDFEMNTQWFAKKLGVHPSLIEQALDLLIRKKAIAKIRGKWKANWKNLSTQKNEDVDDVALREHQKQLLNLAAYSIDSDCANEKSHTAFACAIDPKLIPELKMKIARFRRETATWLETQSKHKTEIYCVQINAFLQTKRGKK